MIEQRERQVKRNFLILLTLIFHLYGKVRKQNEVNIKSMWKAPSLWEGQILQIIVVPEVILTLQMNRKQTKLSLMNVFMFIQDLPW